jgi:hypothetical protein
MKKLAFVCMLLAVCNGIAAEGFGNDTVVVNNPRKVVVVTSDSLQQIKIEGADDNPNYKYENRILLVDSNYVSETKINPDLAFSFGHFRNRKDYSRTSLETTLFVGWNLAPGMPTEADVRPFQSWELWWLVGNCVYRPWDNAHAVSVGVGLDWRNWRINDNYRFLETGDDNRVEITKYPEGAQPKWSRIKVFSVNFPILYQYTTKNIGVALGPVINLNTYGSLKTRYSLNGEKYKDTFTKVHLTPVTVDFLFTVDLRHFVNFYLKYSPCNIIESGYGPKFKTLSFGVFL